MLLESRGIESQDERFLYFRSTVFLSSPDEIILTDNCSKLKDETKQNKRRPHFGQIIVGPQEFHPLHDIVLPTLVFDSTAGAGLNNDHSNSCCSPICDETLTSTLIITHCSEQHSSTLFYSNFPKKADLQRYSEQPLISLQPS